VSLELDHIFICTGLGGEGARCLEEFGLIEGKPNTHPGQGTACRRFCFTNCYLELLWVCDAGEAQSETARPLHLWERWQGRASGAACPFGFGFRPGMRDDDSVLFPTWDYLPAYLPAPLSMEVGTNNHVLTEPLLFCLPFVRRPDRYAADKQPPFHHRARLRELTRVLLISPQANRLSAELAAVTNAGLARVRAGSQYLVELGFDGESQGLQGDFRPMLPLVFRW
jgi:hypothetical protein